QPGDAFGRPAVKPAFRHIKFGAVIAHQFRPLIHQAQQEIGFARAAFAQDQHAGPSDARAAGMDVHAFHAAAFASGNSTTKRAPPLLPGTREGRFSAQMRPPALWVIWRAMERPRPEFLPKVSPGRSV